MGYSKTIFYIALAGWGNNKAWAATELSPTLQIKEKFLKSSRIFQWIY